MSPYLSIVLGVTLSVIFCLAAGLCRRYARVHRMPGQVPLSRSLCLTQTLQKVSAHLPRETLACVAWASCTARIDSEAGMVP